MKVLDLRPGGLGAWQRAGGRRSWPADGRGAPWWSRACAGLLDALHARRVARRPAPPAERRVVSVGNLALGGTGKTPVVARLAADLAATGRGGCVLTRGYGSRLAGPLRVAPENVTAGDEARMLAGLLAAAGWPVVQARQRAAGLAWVAANLPEAEIVLLEDGHQTPVGRHLDILIVDTWRREDGQLVPLTGPVVPCGPWRESARGAARADIVLVEAATPPVVTAAGQPVAGFARRLVLEPPVDGAAPWAALSGVARPERFEADVAEVLGRPAGLVVRCEDHAPYGAATRARIAAALRELGRPLTVTTEKDWTKLAADWPQDLPVRVARQELTWTGTKALPALVGERLYRRREDEP